MKKIILVLAVILGISVVTTGTALAHHPVIGKATCADYKTGDYSVAWTVNADADRNYAWEIDGVLKDDSKVFTFATTHNLGGAIPSLMKSATWYANVGTVEAPVKGETKAGPEPRTATVAKPSSCSAPPNTPSKIVVVEGEFVCGDTTVKVTTTTTTYKWDEKTHAEVASDAVVPTDRQLTDAERQAVCVQPEPKVTYGSTTSSEIDCQTISVTETTVKFTAPYTWNGTAYVLDEGATVQSQDVKVRDLTVDELNAQKVKCTIVDTTTTVVPDITTTVISESTTTTVEVGIPPVGSNTSTTAFVVAPGTELPKTGSSSSGIAIAAGGLLLVGGIMLALRRRKTA